MMELEPQMALEMTGLELLTQILLKLTVVLKPLLPQQGDGQGSGHGDPCEVDPPRGPDRSGVLS